MEIITVAVSQREDGGETRGKLCIVEVMNGFWDLDLTYQRVVETVLHVSISSRLLE